MNDKNSPSPEVKPLTDAPVAPLQSPQPENANPYSPASQTPQAPPNMIVQPLQVSYYYPQPSPSPSTLAIREAAKLKKSPWLLPLSLLAGYIYADLMLQGGFAGLAVPLHMAVYFLIFLWYLSGKKGEFPASGWLLLIPSALLILSYAFIDSLLTNFITTLVLLVLIPIQLTVMAGGGRLSSPSILPAAFTVTIGLPFANMGGAFRIFSGAKQKSKLSSNLGYILIGILCSIPVILIFLALFSSGDLLFRNGLSAIVSWIDFDIGRFILNLLTAALLSLFTIPLFLSLRAAKPAEVAEKPVGGALPSVLILSFLAGILVVQALFVGLQLSYFFSGFTAGALPDDRADYRAHLASLPEK